MNIDEYLKQKQEERENKDIKIDGNEMIKRIISKMTTDPIQAMREIEDIRRDMSERGERILSRAIEEGLVTKEWFEERNLRPEDVAVILSAHYAQKDPEIKAVILTGEGAPIWTFREELSKKFNVKIQTHKEALQEQKSKPTTEIANILKGIDELINKQQKPDYSISYEETFEIEYNILQETNPPNTTISYGNSPTSKNKKTSSKNKNSTRNKGKKIKCHKQ